MNTEQHARILTAYVSRLTLADLSMLQKAKQDCVNSTTKSNTDRQIDAQRWLELVTGYIVEHMTEHDLRLIGDVVEHCTGEDG